MRASSSAQPTEEKKEEEEEFQKCFVHCFTQRLLSVTESSSSDTESASSASASSSAASCGNFWIPSFRFIVEKSYHSYVELKRAVFAELLFWHLLKVTWIHLV